VCFILACPVGPIIVLLLRTSIFLGPWKVHDALPKHPLLDAVQQRLGLIHLDGFVNEMSAKLHLVTSYGHYCSVTRSPERSTDVMALLQSKSPLNLSRLVALFGTKCGNNFFSTCCCSSLLRGLELSRATDEFNISLCHLQKQQHQQAGSIYMRSPPPRHLT
jgi:hypothetical protein